MKPSGVAASALCLCRASLEHGTVRQAQKSFVRLLHQKGLMA